jgi:hypothetical protein
MKVLELLVAGIVVVGLAYLLAMQQKQLEQKRKKISLWNAQYSRN